MLVDPEGRIIIGENIILDPPLPGDCDDSDLEAFLSDEFWYMTREVWLNSR